MRIHPIKAISYPPLDGTRTVFETDYFNVLVRHTHPRGNWTITGRYGEWWIGAKKIWLEDGRFSTTPTPNGGEALRARKATKPVHVLASVDGERPIRPDAIPRGQSGWSLPQLPDGQPIPAKAAAR